jgi:hypothetical protein
MVESAARLLDTYFMNSKLIRIGALQSPIVMEAQWNILKKFNVAFHGKI